MKLNKSISLLSIAFACSLAAEEERSNWKFILNGDVGTYDRLDYEYLGFGGGLEYETNCGTHALLFGIGDVESSRSGAVVYPDIEAISFSYRYSYPLTKRIGVFAELGVERLSWSEQISDAFGNPVSLGSEDTSYFFGIGAELRLQEYIYLIASIRYSLTNNDVFENSALGIDSLGNSIIIDEEAPDFLAKIGLVFKF